MVWVRPLADSDVSCGGKAVGLARLLAAGLPVPDGFVIDDRAFRAIAFGAETADGSVGELAELGHALEQAAQRVGSASIPAELEQIVESWATPLANPSGLLVVRSSATIEDGGVGAAAGVFHSETRSLAEVWLAIRNVWTSALTPLAAIYARARQSTALAIGVIVQRFVPGERVTVYTRPPGAPAGDQVWIQRGTELIRVARDDDRDPIIALALRAEHAIGATTGADVELVIEASQAWIVQARPIVHPVTRPRVPPPPTVIAALVADGRVWRWDASHNPAPLSPAQAGLVDRVERAGVAPWSLRVCGGYLYTARRENLAEPVAPATAPELERRVAVIEEALRRALDDTDAPSVAVAIERYLAFYAIWARELAPLVAAASRAVPADQLIAQRPSRIRAVLEAAATGVVSEAEVIAQLGFMSPVWDVAVPSFGETPDVLRDSIARARAFAATTLDLRTPSGPADELARATADLTERDDIWFYRAQLLVRRALLARGAVLGIPADDICWIPLEDLAGDAIIDPIDARRRAAGARAAHARAQQWSMPPAINDPTPASAVASLSGRGIGPRITGRVVRFDHLLGLVGAQVAGSVVVCQTVTPALAVLVIGCAALVSESRHDGLLDHGVALARELGITCVVGCHQAWSLLGDGAIVTVDGDAGTVQVHGD